MVLVNGVEAWVETSAGRFALSSDRYNPGVVHPDGNGYIEAFEFRPYPRWRFRLPGGTRIEQGIVVAPGRASTLMYWKLIEGSRGTLEVRPFISGRDYHSLHHENPAFDFRPEVSVGRVLLRPYHGVPAIVFGSNAEFAPASELVRNFMYEQEKERGLDYIEDLAMPGRFRWELARGEASSPFRWKVTNPPPLSPRFAPPRCAGASSIPRRLSPPPIPTLCGGAAAGPSSPAIRGSPIGAATPSSRCAGCAWRRARWSRRGTFSIEWASDRLPRDAAEPLSRPGEQPEYNSVDASLMVRDRRSRFLARRAAISAADKRKALAQAVEAISRLPPRHPVRH